jgi:hypothetical protein
VKLILFVSLGGGCGGCITRGVRCKLSFLFFWKYFYHGWNLGCDKKYFFWCHIPLGFSNYPHYVLPLVRYFTDADAKNVAKRKGGGSLDGTRKLESGQNFDFGLINCLARNAQEDAITTWKVTIFPLPERQLWVMKILWLFELYVFISSIWFSRKKHTKFTDTNWKVTVFFWAIYNSMWASEYCDFPSKFCNFN